MNEQKNETGVLEQAVQVMMKNKTYVILLLLVAVVSFLTPIFWKPTNLLNVLRQVSVNTIVAVGFTLVLAAGSIDLSVGAILGFVGVIAAKLLVAEVPIPAAILIALLAGAACGVLNAFLTLTFDLPAFIVTLATSSLFRGIVYLSTNMKAVYGFSEKFNWFGQGYVGFIPTQVLIMFVMVVFTYILVNRTTFGRYTIAYGGNKEAARASGISVNKVYYKVCIYMGVCAALGAIIQTSRSASAQVAAGDGMEMDAIAAVVVGGTALTGGNANVTGTLAGCLIVGIVGNILNLMAVDSNWQVIAKGLMILLAVILDSLSSRIYAALAKRKKIT